MIWYPCTCSDEDQAHDFVRELRLSSGNVLPLTKENEASQILHEISCANCGQKSEIPKGDWDAIANNELRLAQRRKSSLTKFPYFEPHTGILVKSKEHRDEVIKNAGFHKAEHGINDAYSDEFADKLKRDRERREGRKKEIRKKREALIREGVIKAPRFFNKANFR